MKKTIIMIRHGFKTKDNHITFDCLKEILHNGINRVGNEVNRIQLGSACIRTSETAMAFATWLTCNGGRIKSPILPADARFGSDELFGQMVTEKFKKYVKEGVSNVNALYHSANPLDFNRWANDMKSALIAIYDQLDDGDVCFSATHSPTIEMICSRVRGFALNTLELDFKELQGVTFTQGADGQITAELL